MEALEDLDRAMIKCLKVHQGQYRKESKIPYSVHPIEVMKLASRFDDCIEDSVNLLIACLLHDYIEDCDKHLTFDQKQNLLSEEFSPYIAFVVRECSRPDNMNTIDDKYAFLETFKKKSLDALVVKICDRKANADDFYRSGNIKHARNYSAQAFPLVQSWFENREFLIKVSGSSKILDTYCGDLSRMAGIDLSIAENESSVKRLLGISPKK